MNKYSLKFPKQYRLFDEPNLTFTINHIRSRIPSVLWFILHCYKENGDEILSSGNPAYTSSRGVIGTAYGTDGCDYTDSFTISDDTLEKTVYVQLELCTLGIDSENPLYFSELMLQEGDEFNGYHEPYELDKMNSHSIKLPSNMYANLYDDNGNYMQVIRPNKEAFNTNKLDKAQYTILAPHFADEDEIDSHVAVFLEAMNQTEQKIDVLR